MALVAVLGAVLWVSRRRAASGEFGEREKPATRDLPPPLPPPPVPLAPTAPPPAPRSPGGIVTSNLRPDLAFELRAAAVGIDSLRATLDFELVVRNAGRATARGLLIEAWLFAADRDPRTALDRLFAVPAGQPLVATFDLPAASAADITGQSIAARDTLATITAGDRKLFVPMLAVRARYGGVRGEAQEHAAAFMLGVERPGQARLTPLALDRGARRYDALAARSFDG